jgi:hypothetical protein
MTNQQRRSIHIARILRNCDISGHTRRRIEDWCDIAFRAGYRSGLLRAKLLRKRFNPSPARQQNKYTHLVIEADVPFECPVCYATILPGERHEHGPEEVKP